MRSLLFCVAFVSVVLFPSIAFSTEPQDSVKDESLLNPFEPSPVESKQVDSKQVESKPLESKQMEKFFQHFDGNKDGQLDPTERQAVQKALEQIKQNPEFAKQLMQQIEQAPLERKQSPPERKSEADKKLDIPVRPQTLQEIDNTNPNQKLDIPDQPQTLEEKILKYLDKDGDGKLTAQEKAAAKYTKKGEKQGEGKSEGNKQRGNNKNLPHDGNRGRTTNQPQLEKDPKDVKPRTTQERDEKSNQHPRNPVKEVNGNGKPHPDKPGKKISAEKKSDRAIEKSKSLLDEKKSDGKGKSGEKKPNDRSARSKGPGDEADQKEKSTNQSRVKNEDDSKNVRSQPQPGHNSGRQNLAHDRPGGGQKGHGPKNGR